MDNIDMRHAPDWHGAGSGAFSGNTISSLRTLLAAQEKVKGRVILLGGLARHPMETRRWLRFLGSDPLLWPLAMSYPHWALKIYRPYLSRRLHCAARVDVLTQHYGLMRDAGFGDLARQLAVRAKTVCAFEGKSGVAFQLDIANVDMDNREGELYLQLISNDIFLYRAVFSFFMHAGQAHVKIGCVQGLRADDGADSIRSTTRELYGCRPKNLVVSVVRDIGAYFGCKGMIGVGNGNRILARGGRHQKRLPDYDQTWEEMNAERRDDGNFYLSCNDLLKTSFDTIPSKKRSEAKKKNALLASIFQSVRESLEEERFSHER